jgi:hypothetical protein
MPEDPTDLEQNYLAEGYPVFIAEALADLEIGPGAVGFMTGREILEQVLDWQGIIGYTDQILGAIKFLEEQKGTIE